MAIRTIIHFPDSRLREVAKPVTDFQDPNLQVLIDDMFETMYNAKGVGLAATQIAVNLRLSVIDVSPENNKPLVVINPQILTKDCEKTFQEGCLSVPGVYDKVTRANAIKFSAYDRNGVMYEMDAEGLLAECVQHEIDHLNGKLFIDLLSPLKRALVKKKVEKFKREQKRAL